MSIRLQILLGLTFLTCMFSCHSPGDQDEAVSAESILNGPLFASLTDSIERQPKDASLYLCRAEKLSDQNLHELAARDYEQAWELEPDENKATLYASSLLLSGQVQKAITILKQGARTYPGNPAFCRRLSEIYVQQGDFSEAEDQYQRMLRNDSLDFDAWYNLGVLQVRNNDTGAAIASLEHAYRLQPIHLYGTALANLYAETGSPKTVSVCDHLIGPDSSFRVADALYFKGLYYRKTNQFDLAIQQYDACLRKDWKYTEAYLEKGVILFHQHNIDEALNTFAVSAKVSANAAAPYYWMGRCYEKIGQQKQARDSYLHALDLAPGYEAAKAALDNLKK